MNANATWSLLFPSEGVGLRLLSRGDVQVDYSENFARKEHPGLDKQVVTFRRRMQNAGVHAGSLLRLAGLDCRGKTLSLSLGPVEYIDYLALRSAPEVLVHDSCGANLVEDHLPNVVGNVGVVLTADGSTFGVRRSRSVATYRDYIDFPGGHPELIQSELATTDLPRSYSAQVRDELFDAVIREVIEDLAIGALELDEPLLFGVMQNREDFMKPDMAFLITTPNSRLDVLDCYREHKSSCEEVAGIVDFKLLSEEPPIDSGKMTPIMLGATRLLKRVSDKQLREGVAQARSGTPLRQSV